MDSRADEREDHQPLASPMAPAALSGWEGVGRERHTFHEQRSTSRTSTSSESPTSTPHAQTQDAHRSPTVLDVRLCVRQWLISGLSLPPVPMCLLLVCAEPIQHTVNTWQRAGATCSWLAV